MDRDFVTHRDDGTRDYLRRSAGEGAPIGFDALLDATLTASTGTDPALDQVSRTLECSVRFARGDVARGRYTVALGGEVALRGRALLLRALDALDAPGEARAWVDHLVARKHAPNAVIFGVGSGLRKLYVEQRPLPRVLAIPSTRGGDLAMTSLEWGADVAARRRDYLERDSAQALDEARHRLGPDGARALAIVAAWAPHAALVRDDGDGAWTTHWLLAPRPLADARGDVEALAALMAAPEADVRAWLRAVPDGAVRVASLGRTRDGAEHATLYHGPPQRPDGEGRAPHAGPSELAEPDDPSARAEGAVALHLQSMTDGRGAYVVFSVRAIEAAPRPLAVSGQVRVYASSALGDAALARRLAAVVDAEAGTALQRVARAEATLQRVARASGWRVAGVTARPAPHPGDP